MAGQDNNSKSSDSGGKLAIAQRKKMLMVEGAIYRSQILHARSAVRSSLQPGALAQSAIGHLTATAGAAVDQVFNLQNFKNGGLKSLLPLLMSGASLLSKRGLVRPALKVTLVLGAAAAAAYVVMRKRRQRQEAEAHAHENRQENAQVDE
jgi:hypothetical protein